MNLCAPALYYSVKINLFFCHADIITFNTISGRGRQELNYSCLRRDPLEVTLYVCKLERRNVN